jgi:hypothetical protein
MTGARADGTRRASESPAHNLGEDASRTGVEDLRRQLQYFETLVAISALSEVTSASGGVST